MNEDFSNKFKKIERREKQNKTNKQTNKQTVKEEYRVKIKDGYMHNPASTVPSCERAVYM